MPNSTFCVAVVGAGETGTPLLQRLLDAPFVTVKGVADLDPQAPGMQLAQSRDITTTTDFMDLARLGEQLDILIDVTGAPKVRERLRQHMQETGNHHTIIMHEVVVQLLLSLTKGQLVRFKHGDVEY